MINFKATFETPASLTPTTDQYSISERFFVSITSVFFPHPWPWLRPAEGTTCSPSTSVSSITKSSEYCTACPLSCNPFIILSLPFSISSKALRGLQINSNLFFSFIKSSMIRNYKTFQLCFYSFAFRHSKLHQTCLQRLCAFLSLSATALLINPVILSILYL